jgi:UDP-2,4-diacetamido-2,4,6-trideoxy-beta-L-altropyranose hydrolase
MRVAFRVDSSTSIGSGHIMRCLVLAEALRRAGDETIFVSRNLPGNLIGLVRASGHTIELINTSPSNDEFEIDEDARQTLVTLARSRDLDWMVVDHYQIDERWENRIRDRARCVLAIDDLADRKHACDVLLDSGYYEHPDVRYEGLVPPGCVLLQGPRYALLRPEFLEARRRARPRDGSVRRILVFFGGSDPTNETSLALEGLRRVSPGGIVVDVVIGSSNPHVREVSRQYGSVPSAQLHVQTDAMASLMEAADLSLGAGGVAAWERCAVGLPSIVTVTAANQLESMHQLAARESILLAGARSEVTADTYAALVESALRNPSVLRLLSKRASDVMNGCERGVEQCAAIMRRKVNGD